MNKSRKILTGVAALLLMLSLSLSIAPVKASAQPGATVNYQVFYNALAPYGQWLHDPQYGYVWAPNAGPDFRPYYTNGYWAMTEYGNMWISNYSWGWAPFHYGRWVLSSYYGWIWIPGNEWGPAWVSWRQGNGYYGWAPLGPGITINIAFGSGFYMPDPYWTFIPRRYLYSRSFRRYYSPRRTRRIIHQTTIINNTYIDRSRNNTYIAGPRRSDFERATGRKVSVYQVSPRRSAGSSKVSGRTVNVYRPQVAHRNSGRAAAPREARKMSHPIKAPDNRRISNGRQPAKERVSPQRHNRIQSPDRQHRELERQPRRKSPVKPERTQRVTPRNNHIQRQPERHVRPSRSSRNDEPRQRSSQRQSVRQRHSESRQRTPHRSIRENRSRSREVSSPRQNHRNTRATPRSHGSERSHRR